MMAGNSHSGFFDRKQNSWSCYDVLSWNAVLVLPKHSVFVLSIHRIFFQTFWTNVSQAFLFVFISSGFHLGTLLGCQNFKRGKIGCLKKFGQPQLIHNLTRGVITCQVCLDSFLFCFFLCSFFSFFYLIWWNHHSKLCFISLDYLQLILTFVSQFENM